MTSPVVVPVVVKTGSSLPNLMLVSQSFVFGNKLKELAGGPVQGTRLMFASPSVAGSVDGSFGWLSN